jgi:pyruvate ferredoxin oxidoreductase delta subunit
MTEKLRGWKELTRAGIIEKAGNAEEYETGSWRVQRPVFDESKCSHCLLCWIFCPDSAIKVEDGKVVGIDLDHCKGCGICARECPLKDKPIVMRLESECEQAEQGD